MCIRDRVSALALAVRPVKPDPTARAWRQVDRTALAHNAKLLRRQAGCPLMAVIKADGYGHGAVKTARTLRRQGVRSFAVATLPEAIALRLSLIHISGWRSRAEQQKLWDDSMAEHGEAFTRSYVARPGCSEHETGLAIDLGKTGGALDFIRPAFPYDGACGAFRRLAAGYGFIERYQKDVYKRQSCTWPTI